MNAVRIAGPVSILYLTLAVCLLTISGCRIGMSEELPPIVDSQFDYTNWRIVGGDEGVSHFSRLDEINKENVDQLEVAWIYESGDTYSNDAWWWQGSTIEANPIIIDGVLYTTTPTLRAVAIDAVTGQEIWRFDPFGEGEGGGWNRGLAFWENGDDRRLYYTTEQTLHAIDADTGEPAKDFGDDGHRFMDIPYLKGATDEDGEQPGVISPAAPVVFENLVIVGGMSDFFPSNVSAYNARTGEREWSFHNIPHPGDFGYDTWGDTTSYRRVPGPNVWGGLSVDTENEMVFFATGQPKPDFYRPHNPGKHLFGNSVVALNANTGEYVWHFQELHHEIWDLDLPCAPLLATFERNGERVPGLIQLSKTGNTYLFDRLTGKLLSDVEEKEAPPSKLYGEHAWPTQPVVHNPEPFSKQFTVTKDDLTNVSPESHTYALERWKAAETGWMVPPSEQGILYYGIHGGAEWPGGAFNPIDNHLYINSNDLAWYIEMQNVHSDELGMRAHPGRVVYQSHKCIACHGADRQGLAGMPPLLGLKDKYSRSEVISIIKEGRGAMPAFSGFPEEELDQLADFLLDIEPKPERDENETDEPHYAAARYERFLDPDGYPATKPPWGTLNAININTGKISWKVPLGEYEKLTEKGIPPTGTENFGGPVVTAGGLVFIGASKDAKFRAFDKDTGENLWEVQLPYANHTTPATYMIDGRQYVVVPAGGGGKLNVPSGDAWVAYALPK